MTRESRRSSYFGSRPTVTPHRPQQHSPKPCAMCMHDDVTRGVRVTQVCTLFTTTLARRISNASVCVCMQEHFLDRFSSSAPRGWCCLWCFRPEHSWGQDLNQRGVLVKFSLCVRLHKLVAAMICLADGSPIHKCSFYRKVVNGLIPTSTWFRQRTALSSNQFSVHGTHQTR